MEDILDAIERMDLFYHGTGAKAEQIAQAEDSLGIRFADDYRKICEKYSICSPVGHELTGLTNVKRYDVVNVTLQERKSNPILLSSLYVLEKLDIDGVVVWQSSDGSVYQTINGHEIMKLTSNLMEYLAEE